MDLARAMIGKKGDKISVAEAQQLCLEHNIPFFSYRLPGGNEISFNAQLSDELTFFEDYGNVAGKKGFIISPFSPQSGVPALWLHADLSFSGTCTDIELIRQLRATSFVASLPEIQGEDCDKASYLNKLNVILTALKNGNVQKAVLSRTITLPLPAFRRASEWFEKLEEQYKNAFVFFVSIPGVAVWMGATPEFLLKQDKRQLSTMALAGTRPLEVGQAADWGMKELKEQQIVSEHVRQVLDALEFDKLETEGPVTRPAGNVCHLCTTFRHPGVIPVRKVGELLKRLHPTPAVGGVPGGNALKLIQEAERYDRRYYAGFLGPVFGDGTFDLFVNLRSMELFQNAVRLYVGGGITVDSDPEKEWTETEIKSRTLLYVIQNY